MYHHMLFLRGTSMGGYMKPDKIPNTKYPPYTHTLHLNYNNGRLRLEKDHQPTAKVLISLFKRNFTSRKQC